MALEQYRFDGKGKFDMKGFTTTPPDSFKNKKIKLKQILRITSKHYQKYSNI